MANLSVNEEILDATIRHALILERFKKHEAHKISSFLRDEVFPDIIARVEGGLGAIASRGMKAVTSKRLADTLKRIDALIVSGFGEVGRTLHADLVTVAELEAEWAVTVLETKAAVPGVTFTAPAPVVLREIVRKRPVNGKPMVDWLKGLEGRTKSEVRRQVSIGMVQGESVPQMARRLRELKGITMRRAETLVRTGTATVSNAASEATYAENADVVKEVQLVATLDNRTSDICMGYDGRTFPLDEGPRPPFHFNCRTRTVAVTKSLREILGKRAGKASEKMRASMTGEVPAKLTYGQWLRRQPRKIQDEALGPVRARLFRGNRITVQDLTTSTGRTRTLDDLKELIERRRGGS